MAHDTAEDALQIMHVDLDKFKWVNDTYGHAAGDAILENTARIFRAMTKSTDIAARVGGDEFVLVMRDLKTPQASMAFAEALIRRLAQPIMHEGASIHVGASIGIAPSAAASGALRSAIVHADIALYRAKAAGRNRACFFLPEMAQEQADLREDEKALRGALLNGEISPFFQPQFDIETGACVGVEALARWRRPGRGWLAPKDFLRTATQVGRLSAIDQVIFRQACDDYDQLKGAGVGPPRMSVNISAESLPQIAEWPELDRAIVRDGALALELSESIAVDQLDETAKFHMDGLRERGRQIEIDDFGSGRASIVGLTATRPDRLKIDQRVVGPAPSSLAHRALLKSILDMAKALEIDVVAKGVETEAHLKCLRELGCKTAQGFAFAEPLPLDDLRTLLSAAPRAILIGAQAR